MPRSFLFWTCLFALTVPAAGCDHPPDPTQVPPATPPGELPSRAREVPVQKAIDLARVVWPDRSAIDGAVASRLSPAATEAIARAPVPVFVPRGGGLAERALLVVRDNFYAASITGAEDSEGVTISVSASRVVHRYRGTPIVKGTSRVRDDRPAFVTQNERIWSVTFEEHGVHYVVEVECARPSEDVRCSDGVFATKVADELVFVGGSFADGGAR